MHSKIVFSAFATSLLAASSHAALIGWQAEDGASNSGTVSLVSLGDDFDPPVSDIPGALGGSYISTETGGDSNVPGTAARMATYNIDLDAGSYDLYARVFVASDAFLGNGGSGGAPSNDSMFYAREFGIADPTSDSTPFGWARVNGLVNTAPNEAWTWVNLSLNTGDAGEPGSAIVADSSGTHTYSIGGRETGLLIDALAFGTTGETFTAQQLDNAVVIPEPGSFALLALGGLAVATRRRR